jgi:hypothetical protein
VPVTPRARRIVRSALWGVGLSVFALGVVCYVLQRTDPAWWDDHAEDRTARRAEEFENAVVSELSRVRPAGVPGSARSEEWSLRLSEQDLSAWLEHRLAPWAVSRLGRGVPDVAPRVRVRDGVIVLGVRAPSGQVVSAEVAARVDAQGQVWLVARAMRVGRLPMPRGLVFAGEWLTPGDSSVVRDVVEALEGRRPLGSGAVPVDAARRARVLDIRCEEGVLELRLVTEARPG